MRPEPCVPMSIGRAARCCRGARRSRRSRPSWAGPGPAPPLPPPRRHGVSGRGLGSGDTSERETRGRSAGGTQEGGRGGRGRGDTPEQGVHGGRGRRTFRSRGHRAPGSCGDSRRRRQGRGDVRGGDTRTWHRGPAGTPGAGGARTPGGTGQGVLGDAKRGESEGVWDGWGLMAQGCGGDGLGAQVGRGGEGTRRVQRPGGLGPGGGGAALEGESCEWSWTTTRCRAAAPGAAGTWAGAL